VGPCGLHSIAAPQARLRMRPRAESRVAVPICDGFTISSLVQRVGGVQAAREGAWLVLGVYVVVGPTMQPPRHGLGVCV